MTLAANQRRAICGICPSGCWVIVAYDQDGRLAAVRADETSPAGMVCRLGQHAPEIVYAPERLRTPLRRKGPKGGYEFEEISWEQAYAEIAERLTSIKRESGPEACAVYTGRGSFELAMCDVFQPKGVAVSSASSVLFPFGSPNTTGVGALCYVSYAMIAPHVTMGGMLVDMFSDIENAGLIVVWGANPATDSPPRDYKRIARAVAGGAELVVIDPRRSLTAKIPGARWIPIRPGSDGALALGMANVLIAEELHDEEFARDWCLGFEEFASYVQHFRPEVVEDITGVPAGTVVELARKLAEAPGASPVMYTGLEYSDGGVQAIRATMVLWALAAQLDVPGGRCFSMKGHEFPMNRAGHLANPDPRRAVGAGDFPLYSLYRGEFHANSLPRAVLDHEPYAIRSLIIMGASIITSWPQPRVWQETLNALDFTVCIDINLTADCAFADLVLPACTMFEMDSYMRSGPIFRLREKVIEPVGQSRPGYFIMAGIAQALGYGDLYPQTSEELLRHALAGSGFSLEAVQEAGGEVRLPGQVMEYKKWQKGLLRPDGQSGFDTPSGKFEIASSILEEHGYDALPVYSEPSEGPQASAHLLEDYPLVFNSGSRVTTDFRSQFHHIKGLNRERPEPTVTINTRDAAQRGITHGDLVILESPRGRVAMRALVTDDIKAGSVDANMGGGGPLGPKAWQEANINQLTDLKFDPISGFPVYKALLCQVTKAPEQKGSLNLDSGENGSLAMRDLLAAAPPREQVRIYLDHNATTLMDPEVRKAMQAYSQSQGANPSALHAQGRAARQAVEGARRSLAGLLGCTARRLVFTGGGSEANNLVLKGAAFAQSDGRKHLITSSIEHPSILKTAAWLESRGFRVTYLPVDQEGLVQPEDLERALDHKTFLVSIMAANNETGAIQPIKELAALARQKGALFHTDAVQAVGKIPVQVQDWEVDFLTLSAHKFHGPGGLGALYRVKGAELEPLIHGGGQENGLRAGTENAAGLTGLGRAAELAGQRLASMNGPVRDLRERLWQGLRGLVPGARLNGPTKGRLPNTLSCVLPGIRGESMVLSLDGKGVSLSSGSACRAGSPLPSHALLAMGLSEEDAHCSLRWSLGIHNTEEEIDRTLEALSQVLAESRQSIRFEPCR